MPGRRRDARGGNGRGNNSVLSGIQRRLAWVRPRSPSPCSGHRRVSMRPARLALRLLRVSEPSQPQFTSETQLSSHIPSLLLPNPTRLEIKHTEKKKVKTLSQPQKKRIRKSKKKNPNTLPARTPTTSRNASSRTRSDAVCCGSTRHLHTHRPNCSSGEALKCTRHSSGS